MKTFKIYFCFPPSLACDSVNSMQVWLAGSYKACELLYWQHVENKQTKKIPNIILLFLTKVTLGFNTDAHASTSTHKKYPVYD